MCKNKFSPTSSLVLFYFLAISQENLRIKGLVSKDAVTNSWSAVSPVTAVRKWTEPHEIKLNRPKFERKLSKLNGTSSRNNAKLE